MRSFVGVDYFIYSIVLIVALAEYSKAQNENNKIRRAQGVIAYAYPRVGRSDPSLNNNLHEIEPSLLENMYQASLVDYEEYPKSEIKRASLMAYPRVGRNDAEIRKWARLLALQQALDKRTGPSATSGLWFGPRLEDENNKIRRAQGLIAYPRVGRSDPSLNNNLHEIEPSVLETMYQSSLEDYEEYPKSEAKRENLMLNAFPRIGRNDAEIRKWARLLALQQALDKRTGPSATSGLWFGPRLGKRSINKADANEEENHTKHTGQKENY